MEQARTQLNKNRDDILENAFRRGLPAEAQFELSADFRQDLYRGRNHGTITTADAFSFYYSHFPRDQEFFESNVGRLRTPVVVVWGELDVYIDKRMGIEFSPTLNSPLKLLSGVGHYPHLQRPEHVVDAVRSSFR
jgi:pimeloyl-ACP methyl ester carboxylesterase